MWKKYSFIYKKIICFTVNNNHNKILSRSQIIRYFLNYFDLFCDLKVIN